jgi:hypothetical protein
LIRIDSCVVWTNCLDRVRRAQKQKGTMVKPESSTNATIDDDCYQQMLLDAEVVRCRREKAFLEVGFAKVAEHMAINGSSSIAIPALDVTRPSPIECSSSDTYLRNPLINISNVGDDGVSDGGNPKQVSPQHHYPEASPQLFVAPEAALHRDGEQARLVEVVRRRQLQQRQKNAESTYQWLEESANQFWESILVYGGFKDDPRNNPTTGVHSTIPINPYRGNHRQKLNNIKMMKPGSTVSSKTNEQSTDRPFGDQSSSKLRRIIHLLLRNILQVLYAFIDFCIIRLAPSKPLYGNASIAPTYNIQISADDILCFWVIQCGFFILSLWMHAFAFPLVVFFCLTIVSVSRKLIRSSPVAKRNQHGNAAVISREIPTKVSTLGISSRPTNIRYRNCAIQNLQANNPGATSAECSRFLNAVKHDEDAASRRIEEFLKWRSDCGLKSNAEAEDESSSHEDNVSETQIRVFDQSFTKMDEEDWNAAAKIAISIITKVRGNENVATLPQIICSYEEKVIGYNRSGNTSNLSKTSSQPPPRCKDGTRILHILPARLDLTIATAQTYSLAVALYLDRRLCRWSTERITLICDVRGGRGWANPTAWSALPFIQSTASLLGSNYPERLERLVLFPMPTSASWVWSAAQKCLDSNTSRKVVVISSGGDSGWQEKLIEFLDEKSLEVLEKRRR